MTNEEAIKWLKDIHHRFNPTGEKLENEGGDVHLQALDMAIEALKVSEIQTGSCDTCKHKSESWGSKACYGCTSADNRYEQDFILRREAIEAIRNLRYDLDDVVQQRAFNYGLGQSKVAIESLHSAEVVLQTPQTYGKSINPNTEIISDLIRRADAIETVEELNYKVNDGRDFDTICTSDVVRRIKSLPSAEPKTGRWIEEHEHVYLGNGVTR